MTLKRMRDVQLAKSTDRQTDRQTGPMKCAVRFPNGNLAQIQSKIPAFIVEQCRRQRLSRRQKPIYKLNYRSRLKSSRFHRLPLIHSRAFAIGFNGSAERPQTEITLRLIER